MGSGRRRSPASRGSSTTSTAQACVREGLAESRVIAQTGGRVGGLGDLSWSQRTCGPSPGASIFFWGRQRDRRCRCGWTCSGQPLSLAAAMGVELRDQNQWVAPPGWNYEGKIPRRAPHSLLSRAMTPCVFSLPRRCQLTGPSSPKQYSETSPLGE